MFAGVVLFLAALTRGLCRRVLGADDASRGAVVTSASEPPRRAGSVAERRRASSSSSPGTLWGGSAHRQTLHWPSVVPHSMGGAVYHNRDKLKCLKQY